MGTGASFSADRRSLKALHDAVDDPELVERFRRGVDELDAPPEAFGAHPRLVSAVDRWLRAWGTAAGVMTGDLADRAAQVSAAADSIERDDATVAAALDRLDGDPPWAAGGSWT